MLCPKCGNPSDNSANFCLRCGSALPQVVPQVGKDLPPPLPASQVPSNPKTNAAYGPRNPSGLPEEFYKAVIGPKNQDYYLSHFSGFDSNGKATVSWHWPAFFITFYWLLYRKMWLSALIYFLLPFLIMIPLGIASAVAGNSGNTVAGIGYVLFLISLFVFPPLYASALYYKHCKKKIAEANASSQDVQRQLGELSGKGGTSRAALIVSLVFVFIPIIGILAATALPAYQDYIVRARLAEGVIVGRKAADSVANYHIQNNQVPSSLAQAGFAGPIPPSVKELNVDSQNGTVTITMASDPIKGKTLLLVPSLDSNKNIIWSCISNEIPNKYLPSQCRK